MVILLCSITSLYAQKNKSVTVKLSDGSILTGIVEQNDLDQNVKITTEEGDVFIYGMNEVKILNRLEPIKKKGFTTILQAGVLYSESPDCTDFNGEIILGYRTGKSLFGLGAGYNPCNDDYELDCTNESLKLFLHYRYHFIDNRKCMPFVSFSAGFANIKGTQEFANEFKYMVHPSLGLKFRLTSKMSLPVSLGCEYIFKAKGGNYHLSAMLGLSFDL